MSMSKTASLGRDSFMRSVPSPIVDSRSSSSYHAGLPAIG